MNFLYKIWRKVYVFLPQLKAIEYKIKYPKACIAWSAEIVLVDKPGNKNSFSIGDNTYIQANTVIDAQNKVVIGKDCAIAWNVSIVPKKGSITIGDNVWICANSVILANIGDKSTVGAGSVVTRDVPSNSIVAGNPARVIKRRE